MIVEDTENWYRQGVDENGPGNLWNYGAEIWCNTEGQYVSIVADLELISSQPYTMTICSLGLMGVEYVRSLDLDPLYEVILN